MASSVSVQNKIICILDTDNSIMPNNKVSTNLWNGSQYIQMRLLTLVTNQGICPWFGMYHAYAPLHIPNLSLSLLAIVHPAHKPPLQPPSPPKNYRHITAYSLLYSTKTQNTETWCAKRQQMSDMVPIDSSSTKMQVLSCVKYQED